MIEQTRLGVVLLLMTVFIHLTICSFSYDKIFNLRGDTLLMGMRVIPGQLNLSFILFFFFQFYSFSVVGQCQSVFLAYSGLRSQEEVFFISSVSI